MMDTEVHDEKRGLSPVDATDGAEPNAGPRLTPVQTLPLWLYHRSSLRVFVVLLLVWCFFLPAAAGPGYLDSALQKRVYINEQVSADTD